MQNVGFGLITHATLLAVLTQMNRRHTSENFGIKANTAAREIVATMTVEEGAVLEIAIKLPSSWPLKVAEVECRRRVSRHDTFRFNVL